MKYYLIIYLLVAGQEVTTPPLVTPSFDTCIATGFEVFKHDPTIKGFKCIPQTAFAERIA